mmetsp:Transcript_16398/g.24710  ORF Transcript_16398/g.24710 Transcript_16398/m.24710 type:complete len:154 (+) Transcript_16398:2290-2751(+)
MSYSFGADNGGQGGISSLPKGIKAGEKREWDRKYYLIPAAAGLGLVGFGALARRLVRAATTPSTVASGNKRLSDVVGSGLFSKRYAEGGFEKEMTKKEAARILACRENAHKDVILKKYRNLMKTNHPDLGGSRYIGVKLNEAKSLLIKTAQKD